MSVNAIGIPSLESRSASENDESILNRGMEIVTPCSVIPEMMVASLSAVSEASKASRVPCGGRMATIESSSPS